MLAIILGTRPEIIKMAPIIRECQKRAVDHVIIHTGQHYTYALDRLFFDELELPRANYELAVGSGDDAEQTGKMLIRIADSLRTEQPDAVLVEGDTNSVFAGAYAAAKLHIEVAHVEAGLRSYDRHTPEELNRVLTDHIADFLFAPTETARRNLLEEGIDQKKIFITGNTIVDSVLQNVRIAERREAVFEELGISKQSYFLCTSHRQENVDNKARLSGILKGLQLLYKWSDLPIIFPVHPRTQNRIEEFRLTTEGIKLAPPIGFLEFLLLEANAKLVVTDSGGVQEESCILGVPCITLRDNTERPETLQVKSNMLVGTEPERILGGARTMLNNPGHWKNPFGKGDSGKRIVSILEHSFEACGVDLTSKASRAKIE
ncbi:MAG: non-hydrolyzing UDP-N-acetylglucosamine 2-epimerase [Halobacteriota archaeon]